MDPTTSTTTTDTTTARPGVAAPGEAEAFAEATRLYAAGDPHGALALVRPLVDAHPESISARLLVARCAARLGAPAVALATAEEAVACDPSSWEAQVLVAQAATTIDLDHALEAADRALVLAPDQPAAVEARAQVVAARTAANATPRSGGARGALTAALSPSNRSTAPAPAPMPAPLSSLPMPPPLPGPAAAGGPVGPDDTTPRPPLRIPKALAGVVPEGTPDIDTATDAHVDAYADGATRPAAWSPVADGADEARPETEGGNGWDTPGRTVLLVLGSLTWLYVGFRYGVQVIGGPGGIVLFLAVVAFVGLFWRSRLQGAGDRPSPDIG